MIRWYRNIGKFSAIVAIAISMLSSCMDVPLCTSEHPHKGQLSVAFNWGDNTDVPDSMFVLALRPVHRLKVAGVWSTDPTPHGRFLSPVDGDSTYFSHKEKDDKVYDEIYLTSGEYNLMAFSYSEATMPIMNEYLSNIALQDSVLAYKYTSHQNPAEEFAFWQDCNGYGNYLYDLDKHKIFFAKGHTTVDDNAGKKTKTTVNFTPESLSQKLNLSFDVSTAAKGLVVDRVVCCLSGVSDEINITNGRVGVENTCKSVFNTTMTGPSSNKQTVTATIYVPGVVTSADEEQVTGSGILQASVYVHYTVNGEVHRCCMNTVVNLYNTLTKTPSLVADNSGMMRQSKQEVTLRIGNTLMVDKTHAYPKSEKGDVWKQVNVVEIEE